MRFVLTEGNWIPGSAGFGSTMGGTFDWSLFHFGDIGSLDIVDVAVDVIFGNPESALIAMAPLPVVGPPWSPQQLLWRSALALAGVHTGVIKGDDEVTQLTLEILSSFDLQISDRSMWVGPGVEWYV